MNTGKLWVLWLATLAFPLQADEKSESLDLSSFSLAGIRVLPVGERMKAPPFRLETLDTKEEVTLSSYRNRVLVINFWATWCLPCRAAMPAIESLYRELRDQNLAWLAVNTAEDRRTVEKYIEKYAYTVPVSIDLANSHILAFGVLPGTIIINKNGYIVALAAGSVDWRNRNIMEAFQKLLAE